MDDMKEIRAQLADVREWLVRLDTKIDNMADIKATAELALETARRSELLAQENSRSIAEMKTDSRRSWGVIIGMGTSFIGSILIYFLTK